MKVFENCVGQIPMSSRSTTFTKTVIEWNTALIVIYMVESSKEFAWVYLQFYTFSGLLVVPSIDMMRRVLTNTIIGTERLGMDDSLRYVMCQNGRGGPRKNIKMVLPISPEMVTQVHSWDKS